MRGTVHVALAIAMSTSFAGAAETPVWDLAKNEIPPALESGKIERVGNEVTLRDGGAFAIPAEAFPDQKNFTVQVAASVSEMVNGSIFAVMKKQSDGDDGKTDDPRGVVAGKGWALDIPKIEHPQWPKVLIYGDSISMGYRGPFIPEMLEQEVYVFHCCHFVNGGVPKAALEEMAGRFAFDAVVFNNGLHSLHWTPDTVSDQVVHDRMRDLARCFKKGAPQAKIYYLTTTPHTAPRPAPDEPVDAFGEKNDVVIRLNTISEQVMHEEQIEIIDIYSVLAKRLELASGDGYHWQRAAYEIISQEIATRVLPVLGKSIRGGTEGTP